MPVLHPAEIWQQSGRWDAIGAEMFRLKDRNGRDMCLGMTHEEVIAWLAAREIRSYRDLPQIWYQIQTKERDEARPRSGVLRTREFLMKDSYTLDPDAAALELSYQAHTDAYCRIFDRCGIRYVVVESDPGMMGGSGSHEFMAPSAAGEDDVALCDGVRLRGQRGAGPRGAGARRRRRGRDRRRWPRRARAPSPRCRPSSRSTRRYHQVAGLHGAGRAGAGAGAGRPRAARAQARPRARARGAARAPGRGQGSISACAPGSIGPVGVPGVRASSPTSRSARARYVVGANREGFHLHRRRARRRTSRASSRTCRWRCRARACPALRQAARGRAGDRGRQHLQARAPRTRCPSAPPTSTSRASSSPIVMGSYGIGPARIAAAAVEQRHDADGIVWPWAIAPFHVHLVPVAGKDDAQIGRRRGDLRGARGRRASTCSWTTATSGPASSSRTPTSSAARSASPSGRAFAKEGVVEVRERATRRDRKVPRAEVLVAVREIAARQLAPTRHVSPGDRRRPAIAGAPPGPGVAGALCVC